MSNTNELYHRRREALYRAVMQMNGRSGKISCRECDKDRHEAKCLDIDHINEEDSHEDVQGGWQHIYLLEEDIKNNVPLQILCREHHEEKHDRAIFEVSISV